VSANFRVPAYPQGVFGIESLMDHIAHELQIGPVEFRIRNLTRQYQDRVPYTSNGLEDCVRRGAEAMDWKKRWHPAGSDSGVVKPGVKRGMGLAMGAFPSGLGRSSAKLSLDSEGRYKLHVGVTDCGTAAKTTMALIAAEELDVPLEKIDVDWGDTGTCPYSVGESGSRTTVFTGQAVIEAVRDLKRQIREKGPPKGDELLTVSATTDRP
jgi:CO/xanthine dehydrogenase Mo-binding subunit